MDTKLQNLYSLFPDVSPGMIRDIYDGLDKDEIATRQNLEEFFGSVEVPVVSAEPVQETNTEKQAAPSQVAPSVMQLFSEITVKNPEPNPSNTKPVSTSFQPTEKTSVFPEFELICMRGLPGSGKSYIAKELACERESSVICSADDFFMRNGKYEFDRMDLPKAHQFCKTEAENAMKSRINRIIIDNTNIELFEMQPYYDLCVQFEYTFTIRKSNTSWAENPMACFKKCQHNVPKNIIKRRFEDWITKDWTVDKIIHHFNIGKNMRNAPKKSEKSPELSNPAGSSTMKFEQSIMTSLTGSAAPERSESPINLLKTPHNSGSSGQFSPKMTTIKKKKNVVSKTDLQDFYQVTPYESQDFSDNDSETLLEISKDPEPIPEPTITGWIV